MRAHDGGDAPVEIPSEGDFFGSGFGMEIHKHDLRFDLFQKPIGVAKGIVARPHEDASLKIHDGITDAVLLAFVDSPAGQVCGKFAGRNKRRAGLWGLPSAIWKYSMISRLSQT